MANQWNKSEYQQDTLSDHVAVLDDIRIVCVLCIQDATKVIYMQTPNGYRRKKINVCESCLSALRKAQ